MACKLKNELKDGTIKMCDLPAGKLAVVVKPDGKFDRIVQRSTCPEGGFAILGETNPKNEDLSNYYNGSCILKVHVLEEDELIEVHYS